MFGDNAFANDQDNTGSDGVRSNSMQASSRRSLPAADHYDAAEGLAHRGFVGLVVLYFCTSLNDNAYRWLVIPIGYALLGPGYEGLILSVGLACFVSPYILLPAISGYLADRFSKRSVMIGCMIAQGAIILFGMGAILVGNVVWVFAALTLMGVQGALLAPAKSGCVPEIVRPQSISAANGVLGMATIFSAVVGSVLGEELYVLTRPAGLHRWWLSAVVLVGFAAVGWLGGLLVVHKPAADPHRRPPWNMAKETLCDLRLLAADRTLMLVAVGSAFFWFLAAMSQINIYLFSTTELHVREQYVGPLLGMLALGTGIGAVLAGIWSAGKIDLGLVPLSSVGIAIQRVVAVRRSRAKHRRNVDLRVDLLGAVGYSASPPAYTTCRCNPTCSSTAHWRTADVSWRPPISSASPPCCWPPASSGCCAACWASRPEGSSCSAAPLRWGSPASCCGYFRRRQPTHWHAPSAVFFADALGFDRFDSEEE